MGAAETGLSTGFLALMGGNSLGIKSGLGAVDKLGDKSRDKFVDKVSGCLNDVDITQKYHTNKPFLNMKICL